ncbi:MAG: hypothetical protein IKA17_07805 [Clostridia bacterium]|nr:hypothetical protein [Clostridia bacterium]
MLVNKKIVLPIICFCLVALIGGLVYATVNTNATSETDAIDFGEFAGELQKTVENQCKDKEDVNIVFYESKGKDIIATYGDTNIKFKPSSLFKYIVLGIGINEGVVQDNDTYTCNGSYKVGELNFRCFEKNGHGELNICSGIQESCPMACVEIAKKVDDATFYNYLKKLGISLLDSNEKDSPKGLNIIPTAIGNGIEVTPEELLSVYSEILNNPEIFSDTCRKSIYEYMSCEAMNDEVVYIEGICYSEAIEIPTVISVIKKNDGFLVGMTYSEKHDKKELLDITKKILNDYTL